MTYEEAVTHLNHLEGRGWRLGLDRMEAFVERAGLVPSLSNKGYIHIAGTNGKGSTTALVESILRHQGYRTGAFFSPYVIDYRERIQAEGKMIEPDELVTLVEMLLPVADGMADTSFGGATKFELETAMAFAFWEQRRCEWVALEVGLGGRLDATNVVQPSASVIVSLSLDHTSILGSTIEEIAAEKAGIVKPGIPLIVGELPAAAMHVVQRIATERNAPMWRLGHEVQLHEGIVETPEGTYEGIFPGLAGAAMPHNAALAVAACVAAGAIRDASQVEAGVRTAWLPGRFDVRTYQEQEVIFDGAHNADAAQVLAKSLGGRKIHLVSNMLSGHEVAPFYRAFKEIAVGIEVPPIESPRALPVADAVSILHAEGLPATGHASVREALDAAIQAKDGTVVVCGSNYLVGDALRLAD